MNSRRLLLVAAILSSLGVGVPAAEKKPEPLPGTAVLDWTDDISVRIVDEAHRLLDRKTAESVKAREKYWHRDFSSPEAYEKSIQPNRERFKRMIGVVDPRVPVVMERFGDDDNPALVAETDNYRVWQVRWTVLEGVIGEGLLVEPKAMPVAHVVAIPDADQTPEITCAIVEVPHPFGPQGVKGFAEAPSLATAPAIVNAIYDALGVRITSLPADKKKVMQAIQNLKQR